MSREKIFLRVVKGALVPADDYAMTKSARYPTIDWLRLLAGKTVKRSDDG